MSDLMRFLDADLLRRLPSIGRTRGSSSKGDVMVFGNPVMLLVLLFVTQPSASSKVLTWSDIKEGDCLGIEQLQELSQVYSASAFDAVTYLRQEVTHYDDISDSQGCSEDNFLKIRLQLKSCRLHLSNIFSGNRQIIKKRNIQRHDIAIGLSQRQGAEANSKNSCM